MKPLLPPVERRLVARSPAAEDMEELLCVLQTRVFKNKSNQRTRRHFCETNYFNSLVLYLLPLLPYQCRLWSVEWSGVQSVECEGGGGVEWEM